MADKLGIKLDDGVYIGVTGPTYETPAEIRAYKTLGQMLSECQPFLKSLLQRILA